VQLDSPAESASDLPVTPVPPRRRSFCLDRQGAIQALAGIVIALIALIALLTSYDHIALPAGAGLQLPQQWGVWFIVASIALVVVGLPRQSATLNWRRDPGYEQRMKQLRSENARLAAIESRLARFEREHLSSSNPLSSTGDSSPS
jgi:hypothetical protein